MSPYSTITGRALDLTEISTQEKRVLQDLFELYEKKLSWDEFSLASQALIRPVISKLTGEEKIRHPLYKVAQDLEMRLGIAQGSVAPPDYRDYLVDRIEEKYGSRYKFCQETGISQAFLSQVLSGKKDFSLETLAKVLKALDLGLSIMPKSGFSLTPQDAYRAMAQVAAIVKEEIAQLKGILDHLQKYKPELRLSALAQERSIFGGVAEKLLAAMKEVPTQDQPSEVLKLLEQWVSELEGHLGFLREKLAGMQSQKKEVHDSKAVCRV